jgi:ABC-type transport system involved in cytochrome c biogenesis permease subunit
VFFYRLNPFDRALWLYGLGFLSLVLWWATKNRWFARGVWGTILAALVLHGAGIVIRCILRDRPPVSTLYETILSISFLGVGVCALVERIHRMGIALSLAPILGALGLFVANRFEVRLGEDTMPQLVAVLDTNFWLSTHVVCITIGYAGGLLAAAVAHIFVLGRVLGIRRGDGAFYATVARLNYGMLCFGLFFAVVGTILGGIWANESWGRFWGWDPKENGALMICLTQIAILHARMGGYLKSFGVAMASIAGGVVIAFSWWGVNLLGIGLHSYGWTEGVSRALTIFYGFEGLILLAGFWHRLAPLRAPIAPP